VGGEKRVEDVNYSLLSVIEFRGKLGSLPEQERPWGASKRGKGLKKWLADVCVSKMKWHG
jgi:hypothetical protein